MTKKILFILILALIPTIAHGEQDLCENFEGVQATYPEGYSSIGSPGQCYLVPPPVTIDLAPPGGEPVQIDFALPDEAPVTIDVNPRPAPAASNALENHEDVINTAPESAPATPSTLPGRRTITSVDELREAIRPKAPSPADEVLIIIDSAPEPQPATETIQSEPVLAPIEEAPEPIIENPVVAEKVSVLNMVGNFIEQVWEGFIGLFN